jgi:hypothetical protein
MTRITPEPPYNNEPWFVELKKLLRDREAAEGVLDYPPSRLGRGYWEQLGRKKVWIVIEPERESTPLTDDLRAAINGAKLSTDALYALSAIVRYGAHSSSKGGQPFGTPEGLTLREVGALLDWYRRHGEGYSPRQREALWLKEDAVRKIIIRAIRALREQIATVRQPRRSTAHYRRLKARPVIVSLTDAVEMLEELIFAAKSGRRTDRAKARRFLASGK